MLGKIEGRGERNDRRQDGQMTSRLNRHEFAQDPGDGEGQGSLVCYSLWGCKESDMAE